MLAMAAVGVEAKAKAKVAVLVVVEEEEEEEEPEQMTLMNGKLPVRTIVTTNKWKKMKNKPLLAPTAVRARGVDEDGDLVPRMKK
jgi:uncharacterized protein YaiE (UPF0345 family)